MITVANYHRKVDGELIKNLPTVLQAGHKEFLELKEFYEDEKVQNAIDTYIDQLNKHIAPIEEQPEKSKQAESGSTETLHTPHNNQDYYFIVRFLGFLNKPKSRHQIGLFIRALHKSIVDKEIRKTSKYAGHIMKMQDKLCRLYNHMSEGEILTLEIDNNWKDELSAIFSREKVYKSVMLIKNYIDLEGKRAPEKVELLLKAIENAFNKQEITKGDPYYDMIDKIRTNLKQTKEGPVKIEQAELSGLKGIVAEYEQEELNECMYDGPISSIDFAKVKFNTLGFKGKWRAFVGDPTPGFTALIFGKPKSGKSTLSAQFAKYLADNHGKVLYVAKEEGKTGLLQERLMRLGALDENLILDDQIRDEKMKDYDYLVLDSVHKLGFNEQVLDELPKKYPHIKGFLFIMHSTKGGDFRGSQTFAHNVDILIDVDRSGVATQIGRFAQGSEMEIDFDKSYKAA